MTTEKSIFGFGDGTLTVPADSKAYATCVEENSLAYDPSYEKRNCIGDGIDGAGQSSLTGFSIKGGLTIASNYEDTGLALMASMGMPATVDNGDATATHTFDSTKVCLPKMWVEHTHKGFTGDCIAPVETTFYERYTGIQVDSFDLSIEGKGLSSVKLGLIGSEYVNSLLGDTVVPNDGANLKKLGVTDMPYAQGKVYIDGIDSCWLSKFSISLKNTTSEMDLLCNKTKVNINNKELSGTLEGDFDVTAYQKIFSKDGSKSFPLKVEYDDGKGSKLTFLMGHVKFEFKGEAIKYGESMMINATWTAFKGQGDTELLKVQLTNKVLAY